MYSCCIHSVLFFLFFFFFFAIENNLGIVLIRSITVNTFYLCKNASTVNEFNANFLLLQNAQLSILMGN